MVKISFNASKMDDCAATASTIAGMLRQASSAVSLAYGALDSRVSSEVSNLSGASSSLDSIASEADKLSRFLSQSSASASKLEKNLISSIQGTVSNKLSSDAVKGFKTNSKNGVVGKITSAIKDKKSYVNSLTPEQIKAMQLKNNISKGIMGMFSGNKNNYDDITPEYAYMMMLSGDASQMEVASKVISKGTNTEWVEQNLVPFLNDVGNAVKSNVSELVSVRSFDDLGRYIEHTGATILTTGASAGEALMKLGENVKDGIEGAFANSSAAQLASYGAIDYNEIDSALASVAAEIKVDHTGDYWKEYWSSEAGKNLDANSYLKHDGAFNTAVKGATTLAGYIALSLNPVGWAISASSVAGESYEHTLNEGGTLNEAIVNAAPMVLLDAGLNVVGGKTISAMLGDSIKSGAAVVKSGVNNAANSVSDITRKVVDSIPDFTSYTGRKLASESGFIDLGSLFSKGKKATKVSSEPIELFDAKNLPLSDRPEIRAAQEKMLRGEKLGVMESVRTGARDNAVTKLGDYELRSDYAYRAVHQDGLDDYLKTGLIKYPDDKIAYGGAIHWYLGGAAPAKSYGNIVLETPANIKYFQLADDYGGFMSGHPSVRHMYSFHDNPISMDDVTRVFFMDPKDRTKVVRVATPAELRSEMEVAASFEAKSKRMEELLTNEKFIYKYKCDIEGHARLFDADETAYNTWRKEYENLSRELGRDDIKQAIEAEEKAIAEKNAEMERRFQLRRKAESEKQAKEAAERADAWEKYRIEANKQITEPGELKTVEEKLARINTLEADSRFMASYSYKSPSGKVVVEPTFLAQKAEYERLIGEVLDDTGLSEAFRVLDNFGAKNGVSNYSDVIIRNYESSGWDAVKGNITRNSGGSINPREVFSNYSAEDLRKFYDVDKTRGAVKENVSSGVSSSAFPDNMGIYKFSSREAVAETIGDSKQFLYLKLKTEAKNNPALEKELDDYFNSINRNFSPQKMDEGKLVSIANKYLSNSDMVAYRKIVESPNRLFENPIPLTQYEKDVIYLNTKNIGCAENSWLRLSSDLDTFSVRSTSGELNWTTEDFEQNLRMTSRIYGLGDITPNDIVRTYDSIIDRSVLKEDVISYSGIKEFHDGTRVLEISDVKVGTTFTDKGYRSSSLVKEYEYGGAIHSNQKGQFPYILEIKTPKGFNAAYLESESGLGRYAYQELVHPRGTKLKVTGAPYKDSTGRTIIPCEVVYEPPITTLQTLGIKTGNNVEGLTQYHDRYYLDTPSSINLSEFDSYMNRHGLLARIDNDFADIEAKGYYAGADRVMGEHGLDHVKRVTSYALYMGKKFGLSESEMNLLAKAVEFHDVGIVSNGGHLGHAEAGANKMLSEILANDSSFSQDGKNIIAGLIEYHEMPDSVANFNQILNKYGISEYSEMFKELSDILKDADAIDRVRFPGNLDTNYLRNKELTEPLVKAACEIHEARGSEYLEKAMALGDDYVKYIQTLRERGISDYEISFKLKYRNQYKIKGVDY